MNSSAMPFDIDWQVWDDAWDELRARLARWTTEGVDRATIEVVDDLALGQISFVRDGRRPVPSRMSEAQWAALTGLARRGWRRPTVAQETQLGRWMVLPVGELAWNLAIVLRAGEFETAPGRAMADYYQHLESLHLRFIKADGTVVIANEEDVGWTIHVPEEAFFGAVRRFLTEFVGTLAAEVPEFFDWTEAAPLMPFLTRARE